ncbi:MAG: GTPase Era [Chitinispirillaceae bacterium]|nr:GTPase Era [Chitinispirillaceae bacterium]
MMNAQPPSFHKGKNRFRSGFVVLLGRPNSGKSTLLNAVIGEELSPVTPLPQTTRRRISGVYTAPSLQIVFIDTPGIHRGGRRLNRAMLNEAERAARDDDVDCLCYIVDLSRDFGEEESLAAAMTEAAGTPRLIVFNKKDLCAAPETGRTCFFSLFPRLAGTPSVTISAIDPKARETFLVALDPFIREGPRYFDEETVTDAPLRSLAAEFLRKHLILATRNEVPHAVFVEIESYREREGHHDIRAVIHVETAGQRGIIIGSKGALLERIRGAAERELSRIAGCPVRISCHVTVTPHWRNDQNFLRQTRYFPV